MRARCCCVCGKPQNFPADKKSELRPYGPGGADICFRCANEPERKAQTEAAMRAQMDAALAIGGGVATIGGGMSRGPEPGAHIPPGGRLMSEEELVAWLKRDRPGGSDE